MIIIKSENQTHFSTPITGGAPVERPQVGGQPPSQRPSVSAAPEPEVDILEGFDASNPVKALSNQKMRDFSLGSLFFLSLSDSTGATAGGCTALSNVT